MQRLRRLVSRFRSVASLPIETNILTRISLRNRIAARPKKKAAIAPVDPNRELTTKSPPEKAAATQLTASNPPIAANADETPYAVISVRRQSRIIWIRISAGLTDAVSPFLSALRPRYMLGNFIALSSDSAILEEAQHTPGTSFQPWSRLEVRCATPLPEGHFYVSGRRPLLSTVRVAAARLFNLAVEFAAQELEPCLLIQSRKLRAL